MHLLEDRTYAGEPSETVRVETEVHGGGHVTVAIDGVQVDSDPTFTLKPDSGQETIMRIGLIGAEGESCVVTISEVDGGTDGDLLLCQSLDPAPVHRYRFIVTPAAAVASLRRAARRRTRKAAPRRARKAPKTRKTPKRRGR
jgi:hypothetical protein